MKIGITGLARHGKSTAAAVLIEEFGFTPVNFADSLRRVLLATNPFVGSNLRLVDLIEAIGWERAKDEYPEVRRLMKILATEGVRDNIAEDAWIQAWDRWIADHGLQERNIVAADLRFPNEAHRLLQTNGMVWQVVRPGWKDPASDGHRGELGLAPELVTHSFVNTGSVEEFRQTVRVAALRILEGEQ